MSQRCGTCAHYQRSVEIGKFVCDAPDSLAVNYRVERSFVNAHWTDCAVWEPIDKAERVAWYRRKIEESEAEV